MTNKGRKKTNINFSKLFHEAFDFDDLALEKFSSALFFLATKDGQMITMREIGGYEQGIIEVVYRLSEKIISDRLPSREHGYVIDAIPITITSNRDTWEGFFGAIINDKEGNDDIIRTLLVGHKHSIVMAMNYLTCIQNYEKQRKSEKVEQLLIKILKETGYTNDVMLFAQTYLSKLKEITLVGDFALLLLNRNDDLFIPRYSTNSKLILNKENYIVCADEINELVKHFEEDQTRVLTKSFARQYGVSSISNFEEEVVYIPLEMGNKIFAILSYYVEQKKYNPVLFEQIIEITNQATGLFYKLFNHEKMLKEQKRKELLLHVTKKFHSSMDVSAILGEIIKALNEVFPSFDIHLLLSHEWEVTEDLPVKQLSYGKDQANEIATNAYLTGKIQIEDLIKERISVVYAPLRGKQGVYGVLQIMADNSFVFPKHEIDFIEVLADTGGNAIENAELYQQSRQLVEDLQLINKTSHQLNSNLRLSETISYMTNQIKSSFNAQEIGFFMFRSNGEVEVLEGSTNYFLKDEILADILPFCERIRKDKDALFIGDLATQNPYLLKPYRSFIAVPMVQSGDLKGAVFIVHEQSYHFSFNKFKLLQSLIHHSTLAFTNSMLHEELEKLVITDHLTRLYARNYLDEKIQESMLKDAYGCFILMDIDNFKQINDVYGHQVGDEIIIQVANILKKNIKSCDIAARWGGEELAVYLSKVDSEIGVVVAERIREKVFEETSPQITISCGVSDWKQVDKDKSLKTLFNHADQALYTAKRSGKNRVIVYDKDTCHL